MRRFSTSITFSCGRTAAGTLSGISLLFVRLSSAHHWAIHNGKLLVQSAPSGLRFFHADGTPYGSTHHAGPASPACAEARTKAESALKLMGFPLKDVKVALGRISGHSELSLEQLLRQGLAELG